jgi:putative phosphoribosyl transferase
MAIFKKTYQEKDLTFRRRSMPEAVSPTILERHVEIPIDYRRLNGILRVPEHALGVVVFAHGSGSGRFSPRNQFVARVLEDAGLATLLLDLLEDDEADDREMVFNIELLSDRLQCAADWISQQAETRELRLSYFGASTGAAAALLAAARKPRNVGAVVCRGGRPDLAMDFLEYVKAPTLLIVGGNDNVVLHLNERALRFLRCEKQLTIVHGASHLFEEPGALDDVARMAQEWLIAHIVEPKEADRTSQLPRKSSRVH